MIYFIRGGDLVKIGKANNVNARLRNLRREHTEELRVIATIPGNEKQERKLHDRFRERRVHGEWFSITNDEALAAAAEFSANEENYPAFTASDFVSILSSTLSYATEAGLSVGVKNRPASPGRAAGLLIFIGGLSTTADGRLVAGALIPEVIEGDPDSRADAAVVVG